MRRYGDGYLPKSSQATLLLKANKKHVRDQESPAWYGSYLPQHTTTCANERTTAIKYSKKSTAWTKRKIPKLSKPQYKFVFYFMCTTLFDLFMSSVDSYMYLSTLRIFVCMYSSILCTYKITYELHFDVFVKLLIFALGPTLYVAIFFVQVFCGLWSDRWWRCCLRGVFFVFFYFPSIASGLTRFREVRSQVGGQLRADRRGTAPPSATVRRAFKCAASTSNAKSCTAVVVEYTEKLQTKTKKLLYKEGLQVPSRGLK